MAAEMLPSSEQNHLNRMVRESGGLVTVCAYNMSDLLECLSVLKMLLLGDGIN